MNELVSPNHAEIEIGTVLDGIRIIEGMGGTPPFTIHCGYADLLSYTLLWEWANMLITSKILIYNHYVGDTWSISAEPDFKYTVRRL